MIRIVNRRIAHHAGHSGYDTVFKYMNIQHADTGISSYLANKIPASIRWRLHRLKLQKVGDEGLIPELSAISTTASKKPGICHFIYGEDTYFYTPLWQHRNKKIIATYHYPPARLAERVNPATLASLAAVILMSESQRTWFEKYLEPDNIHVVHHHIDTDFFRPSPTAPEQKTKYKLITLGGILRDMTLLLNVITHLNESLGEENIEFDLLIPQTERPTFRNIGNVILHSNISDESLLVLYQQADLGFMPLIDCTANNAVLEMMASGTAIACTNVGGISDYLDDHGALLLQAGENSKDIADKITSLLKNREQLEKMGQHNRQKAEKQFSLQETSKKLYRLYDRYSQPVREPN